LACLVSRDLRTGARIEFLAFNREQTFSDRDSPRVRKMRVPMKAHQLVQLTERKLAKSEYTFCIQSSCSLRSDRACFPGVTLRRNQAALLAHTDEADDMSIESRVAKFESELGHLKKDTAQIAESVGELQKEAKTLREDMSAIKATLPHLATKADLHKIETTMVRWFIYTALGAGSLAFGVAKLVA
jgi:hypothetical protein